MNVPDSSGVASPPSPLARIETAHRLLAEARTIDEVKNVRDQAAAAAYYAKERGYSQDMIDWASEIKVRAERKAGELLVQMPKNRGAAGNPGGQGVPFHDGSAQTLAEIGVTPKQSMQWQQLASVPETQFEQAVAEVKSQGDGLSTTAVGRQIQSRVNAGLLSSETPEWYTPQSILDRVVTALGAIDLDPCSNPDPHNVPAQRHFTIEDDGLSREWFGRVYMNPPYGDAISAWTAKLRDELMAGRATEAIALVPGRIDTSWWDELTATWPCVMACFIRGRLRFSRSENSAPFPSVVLYFGRDSDAFVEAFKEIGHLWVPLE